MRPDDLRAQLSDTADLAGPGHLNVDRVMKRVRRKRRLQGAAIAGVGLAVASLGVLILPQVVGERGAVVAQPGEGGSGSESPTGRPGALPTSEFVCGQPWDTSGTARASHGLSVTVHATRPANDESGPVLQVRIESDQPRDLVGTPPRNVQIIYLKDGLVVGGGPLLREPGDTGLQVTDMAGYGVSAAPGKPGIIDVGPRNTLCPSTSWRDIWAAPGRYEVVVTLAEPVNASPGSPVKGAFYNLIDKKPLT